MEKLIVQVSEMLTGNTPKVRKAVFLLFENARSCENEFNCFDEGQEMEFYFNLSVAILKYPERVDRMLMFLTEAEDFNTCLTEMNSFLDSGVLPEGCL